MKQKIFLTSCIAMGVIAPAFAELFPLNGYMRENKTYTNAATSKNMDGVYEGTVNAVAEYAIIDYIVNAGQYLPADSETVITCPAGSFCPGISGNVQYNQSASQGIQTCPTGYDSSAAGASSDTQCYRQCSGNVTIEHATGVTGFDYYGAGVDTCAPTSCENGWHVKPAVPNLTNIIGVSEAGNGYTVNNVDGSENYSDNMSNTIIANDPMAFAVDYGTKGIIKGHGRCSTHDEDSNFSLADETWTGENCYCRLDSYTPNGGTEQSLLTPWVFHNGYYDNYVDGVGGPDWCATVCAGNCALLLRDGYSDGSADRAALFGSVIGGGSCEANEITINWSNTDAADITANNAGTATYGSDVRTPVKAQTIKGKTFRGWRFSKPETTNLPE